jgi:hypothetical protein
MLLAAVAGACDETARLALEAAWCDERGAWPRDDAESRALARALLARASEPVLGALALYVLAELVRADPEAGALVAADARALVRAADTHPAAAAGALWAVARADPHAVLAAFAVPVLLRIARGACDDAAAEAVLALCALAACPDGRAAIVAERGDVAVGELARDGRTHDVRSVADLALCALAAGAGAPAAPDAAPRRAAITLGTVRAALARLRRPP